MSRVMKLTSPHMKGKNIAALQRLLKEKGYLEGKVDSEYGPDTARAVFRAKHVLGYPKPDKVAGDKLYGFLSGRTKPTLDMRIRARRRAKQEKKLSTIGLKMLTESVKYLGMEEHPPGSNNVIFSRWYGIIGPWCAMVVSFCGVKVGSKTFKKGSYYAYCPFIFADAQRGRNGLMLTYRPKDGNLVLFDWQGMGQRGVADHVGLWASERTLVRIAPSTFATAKKQFGALGKGDFWCVEGNTGVGNDSNGGAHMIRKRNKSQVQAYVEVRK
jgi:Putative peptidoglycan binding domain